MICVVGVVGVVKEKFGAKGPLEEKEDVGHPKTMPLRGW